MRENPFFESISLWKRYIDDILVIWRGGPETLMQFHQWMNSRNNFLKFTVEIDKHRISFLDLSIYSTPSGLQSELYRKPMARNSLLQYDSQHPKSLRSNLPYGQFLRVRRNCYTLDKYKDHADQLAKNLRARNYPSRLVKRSYKRAANNNREALLEPPVVKPPLDRLTFVSTFCAMTNEIQKSVRKHWRILNCCTDKIPPPLFSLKRGYSLRDQLVHMRPRNEEPRAVGTLWDMPAIQGHFPCGSCSVCHQTKHTENIDIGTTKPWRQLSFTNCNSTNLIYLIICPCNKSYVGMTTRKLKIRISEHKSNFRCKKTVTRLMKHFVDANHKPDEFSWTVLEKPYIPSHISDVPKFLFMKEQRWVYRLLSDSRGLNDTIPWGSLR